MRNASSLCFLLRLIVLVVGRKLTSFQPIISSTCSRLCYVPPRLFSRFFKYANKKDVLLIRVIILDYSIRWAYYYQPVGPGSILPCVTSAKKPSASFKPWSATEGPCTAYHRTHVKIPLWLCCKGAARLLLGHVTKSADSYHCSSSLVALYVSYWIKLTLSDGWDWWLGNLISRS